MWTNWFRTSIHVAFDFISFSSLHTFSFITIPHSLTSILLPPFDIQTARSRSTHAVFTTTQTGLRCMTVSINVSGNPWHSFGCRCSQQTFEKKVCMFYFGTCFWLWKEVTEYDRKTSAVEGWKPSICQAVNVSESRQEHSNTHKKNACSFPGFFFFFS